MQCFRLVLNVDFQLPALLEDLLQFITLKVDYLKEQSVMWGFAAIYRKFETNNFLTPSSAFKILTGIQWHMVARIFLKIVV